MSHFVYWAVFGGFNDLFLDHYHKKSLLITLLQQIIHVEQKVIQALIDATEQDRQKKIEMKEMISTK